MPPTGMGGSTGVGGSSGAGGTTVVPPQGLPSLTAGMWDDNANYDVFIKFVRTQQQLYMNSLPLFNQAATDAARAASLQRQAFDAIDISLVLDTTGSMGDELVYLQNEFNGISTAVAARFPNTSVRWGLVAYRDVGDDYVTRGYDFTAETATFQANLATQRAGGGGDEPEAVPAAFSAALSQSWRGATAAQMLLWVADAPHHDAQTAQMTAAIVSARDKGIRVYPVASSNANPLCEATMRVAAQLTGGRYVFLTDDSGVGGGHSEPKIPCYYVTKLNDAIVRSVAMELTGKYVAPSPDSIVRVVGSPIVDTCIQPTGGDDTIAIDSGVPEAATQAD
jgi:hypothetical protein